MTNPEYDFPLPSDLIAQEPAQRRGDARLLSVAPGRGVVGESVFRDLPALLRAGDLLVLNESRVLPARLFTRRPGSGGRVELLLVAPTVEDGAWTAMARPARRLRAGTILEIIGRDGSPGPRLETLGRAADGLVIVRGEVDPGELAAAWGVMPLPPYIHRDRDETRAALDRERYQTVFAAQAQESCRSVAAPTAGLHFSQRSLAALADAGIGTARVQLHVGPGTFQPPTPGQIATRRLHREVFSLPAETSRRLRETWAAGGRVVAVGTTSLRVLETVKRLGLPDGIGPDERAFPADHDPDPVFRGTARLRDGAWDVAGETRLFLAPPDRIGSVDGLLTNFHLPGSSLLMLVASLVGDSVWRRIYDHAVAARLRFYSYGDCMLALADPEEAKA